MQLPCQLTRLLKSFERDFATHNRIEVSKSALRHNYQLFSKLTGQQIIPVLKGNAYGHGLEATATALSNLDVPYLAVDGYFEALRIRQFTSQPILVMGAIRPGNYSRMAYREFAFVVQDQASIRALGSTGKRLKVHLECNTGMNRYGATPADVEGLTKLILSYPKLELEGIMSHLADSDGNRASTVDEAVERFDTDCLAVRRAGANPCLVHVAQTAGSLRVISPHVNAFRLGIGLYGINPFEVGHKLHEQLVELRPALRLVSTITHINQVRRGEGVSYNYTFVAPTNMKIGVLPLGYYEAVPRALSNVGSVKIGRQFVPIVGRICMNHLMVDLSGIDATVGDEVTVYSNLPEDVNSISAIASSHGIFSYSLLTGLSPDVRRVLVD